jgi:hypothetical protein
LYSGDGAIEIFQQYTKAAWALFSPLRAGRKVGKLKGKGALSFMVVLRLCTWTTAANIRIRR